MSKLNEKAVESFAISEAHEFEKQQHHVGFDEKSNCECLQRKYSFSLWQILIFLLLVATIIVLLILLSPGVLRGKKAGASKGDKSSEGETTVPATTTKISSIETTTTQRPSTTENILTTKGPDVECGVVIVGGGAGSLLLAYMLLKKQKETSVCIFEQEHHLGGKISDHSFSQAPDIPVGLGRLLVLGDNGEESRVFRQLLSFNAIWNWERSLTRVEARAVFADDFNKLKQNAFPTLNRSDTVETMADDVSKANSSLYSTAGAFLSFYLSPEGRELLEDTYGLKLEDRLYNVNPESYKKYLEQKRSDEKEKGDDRRPDEGLFKLIQLLEKKVNESNGSIYFREKVKSVMKEGSNFFLQTTKRTVRASKTVLAGGPTALKDMTGDVIQNITNHKILRSIVSVPAFFGAAVYQNTWWKDSKAVKPMAERDMFISNSNCLGIIMPYGVSTTGKGVLQTIANTGSCSIQWGSILKTSKDNVDRDLKKALKIKFEREIPDALSTVYKYWENGFWYLQKAGTNFSLEEIRTWAKRPLPGSDVFLIGAAFYNFGGSLEDTIRSTNETLVEGWQTELKP